MVGVVLWVGCVVVVVIDVIGFIGVDVLFGGVV